MRSLLFFLSFCLLVTACKNNKDTKDHLSPKVMRQLLLDVNVAEAYSSFQRDSLHKQQGSKNLDSLAVYYKDVLAHYNITPEQFTENLEWYKGHPDDLDTIYNDMIPVATGIQSAVTPLPKPAPAAPIALPGKK